MLLSALVLAPADASDLQWRTGHSPATKATRLVTQPRFMPPRQASYRLSSTVRLAQFEEPAPSLTDESDSQLRSVVVERGEFVDSVRSAQVPALPDTSEAAPDAEMPAAQEGEPARNPFGDLPQETSQFQTPTIDSPPVEFQPALPPDGIGFGEPTPSDLPAASEDVIEDERQKAAAACSRSLGNLQTKTIERVILSIAVSGSEGVDYPFECSIDRGDWHPGRAWEQTTYLWKASALCHKPLYFEDEQLERYGHSFSPCCQPLISGAHFFCTLPVLPYCMGVSPPMECEYALGHYRPGSCAPYMINPVPISCRGALFQAGAVVGTAAVLP